MNRQDVFVLGVSWFLINIMAGYGAAKLLGGAAWTYVVFIVLYIYYVYDVGARNNDK